MAWLSFDIFCRVVDNYGDIGVCWRLARRLAAMPEHHLVRLWVDDMGAFSRIEPRASAASSPVIDGVDIVHWTSSPPNLTPHAVVVEAFACDPPPAFVTRMVEQRSLWINLEYLSAESWVESCHALPSQQANGLRKAFFFPGFTVKTGGLLREPTLLAERDAWLADRALRDGLLRKVGLPEAHIAELQAGAQQILLFAYPQAPAGVLLEVLTNRATPSVLLVPTGVCPDLPRGQHGATYVHDMPFVDQRDFDRLLWSSDLNCVRGEDSLVRALWAGKPLLWHIYPQTDGAHMTKLDAWLVRSPFKSPVAELMRAWNHGDSQMSNALLQEALRPKEWADWQAAAAAWSLALAQLPELADALVKFCWRSRN